MRLHSAALGLLIVAASGCASHGGMRASSSDEARAKAASQNVALAQNYLDKGQYEVALEKLQRALKQDPNSADAHTVMGVLYERLNRPEKAEAHYQRSTKLAPEQGAILNNYGAWLCRSGRPADADSWFVRALDDPFYKTPLAAISNAGTCAQMAGDLDKAEAYFRRALELDPKNRVSLQELALLSFKRGDYLRARAFAQRRDSLKPVSPEFLELAALIEDRLGDADAADAYRTRLRTQHPEYRQSTTDSTDTP
jgi:type IV pilus assembly protein PilF